MEDTVTNSVNGRELSMLDASVTQVVERFRMLTADQMAAAYVEIDTIWRTLQDDGVASNSKVRSLPDE
jgi:hypothetical protein